jgi:acyl carrier protein
MELEEEFDLQIPDEEAATIHTFSEALQYLERRRRTRGAPGA